MSYKYNLISEPNFNGKNCLHAFYRINFILLIKKEDKVVK